MRRVATFALLLGLAALLELGFDKVIADAAWRQIALFAMVNIVVALSLNVINGMAGQFSIGHAGFVGIGAYTAAIVASNLHKSFIHTDDILFKNSFLIVPPALIAAMVMASIFGVLVGLPSLRLKGDYLAIVTLGFAEIFRLVLATAQTGGEQTGFAAQLAKLGGAQGYAGPDNAGCVQYAGPFWIFGAVFVTVIIAWRLKFSGWGRALRALREDEIASAAVGVDPTRYKVVSFVIAAAGAGLAGGLLAQMRDGNPTVQPDQFTFAYSFDAITMVILGGSGSVSGAILGGVFVTVSVKLIEQLQGLDSVQAFKAAHESLDLNALRMVVYASILIALMIWRPEGIFGEREVFRRKRREVAKTKAEARQDRGEPVEKEAKMAETEDGKPIE